MFACIMAMSATSVAASVLVLYFHHHDTSSRPPKPVRVIFFKILAPMLCLCDRMPNRNQVEPEKQADVMTHGENDVIAFEYVSDDVKVRPRSPVGEGGGWRQVVGQLKQMTGKLAEDEREERVAGEWRAVAVVLDRLFFFLTLITMTTGLCWFLSRDDEAH